MGQRWAKIRRVWAICGTVAFVAFTLWGSIAYQASAEGEAALEGDRDAGVERGDGYWSFKPRVNASRTGLLFFPGALVEPAAYAPVTHAVAAAGFPALLVDLPWRGAFGRADGPEVLDRARSAMKRQTDIDRWIIAGHSRGGKVAAILVQTGSPRIAGLVLIATSHPRDFSLADVTFPVTRIYGTRDTVADLEKLERTRGNLPPSTRMVPIDGGNHSQFGYYGFQPGDWPATISRGAQHKLTLQAILDALQAVTPLPKASR